MTINAEALEQIRSLVRGGFESKDRMIQILCEEMYEPGELDPEEVSAAIDGVIEELRIESAHWPAITDCDRLEAAFAAMRARGIVALPNAGYTQSDGYDDVLALVDRHKQPDQLIGYCFYHGQDLERAVTGSGLYLAFGPIDPKQEQSAGPTIGRLIVEELERAGLRTEWDGTFNQRIAIPALTWQLRRGEGAVGEIAPGVREAIAGGDQLCATFEIEGAPDCWVQFVGTVINAAWPHRQDPAQAIAKIGNAVVESYEARKFVTAQLQTTNALEIARLIDAYFQLVLGAKKDYRLNLALDWI